MSSTKASETVWRLRRGMDRRFRSGHPWVYSNEIEGSPKGVEPGAPVELRDAAGKFLARGFGNPSSLIAFRSLSRDLEMKDPTSLENITRILESAAHLRASLGLSDVSHRLCFGEADGIPGLVIDRFRTEDGQVFVIQAHSAGADRLLPQVLEALERLAKPQWNKTAVVLRNDLSVRKLEGLKEEEPKILKPYGDLKASEIWVRSALGGAPPGLPHGSFFGPKNRFFPGSKCEYSASGSQVSASLFCKFHSDFGSLQLCGAVGRSAGAGFSGTGRSGKGRLCGCFSTGFGDGSSKWQSSRSGM